jgi:hypothetical protein
MSGATSTRCDRGFATLHGSRLLKLVNEGGLLRVAEASRRLRDRDAPRERERASAAMSGNVAKASRRLRNRDEAADGRCECYGKLRDA